MILTVDEDIVEQIERTNDPSLLTKLVLESETNSSPIPPPPSEKISSPKKSTRGTLTCVVCQSSATGYNFGAITCESCKAFFRRNAGKDPSSFRCRFHRNCEINMEMRRYCPACRLAKCLERGMQRDRMASDEQRATKRRKLDENRTLTLQTSSPADEQPIPSAIPSDVGSLASQTIPLTSVDLSPMDTDVLFLTDFTECFPSEPKPALLTPAELQRIEQISLAYQKRLELATPDILPSSPSARPTSFSHILNSHAAGIMRLLSFFKQLPEFNQLNLEDKVTLVKYNLMPVIGISSVLLYKAETHQIRETEQDTPIDFEMFQLVYGHQTCAQLGKSFHSFLRIAKSDPKIIQLLLIVLILSKGYSIPNSSEPVLNDGLAVYHVQNTYTELLWKYMEATHGLEVAVRLFSELIVHAAS